MRPSCPGGYGSLVRARIDGIVVADQGPGFDVSTPPDPTDPIVLERPSGRGILLMRAFMTEVRYNAIGNRVTLKCGVYVWDGVTLEDDVFCGPNATFTNDRRPRSRIRPSEFPNTLVERDASIGAGAVILPGVTIGSGALIGAGAVVTRDVPEGETWVGNPARPLT